MLEYEWNFIKWNFSWLWKKYRDNGSIIYKWQFALWEYHGEWILYNEDRSINYKWFFIKWYPEKKYNDKIIEHHYRDIKKQEECKKIEESYCEENEEDSFYNQIYDEEDDVEFSWNN